MKIPIPHAIAHVWDIFCDWGDVDVIGPIAREDGVTALVCAASMSCSPAAVLSLSDITECFTAGSARCRAGLCIY